VPPVSEPAGTTGRFVVVGEAIVDVVVDSSGHELEEAVGGSPLNVAVGLARLDVPTLLVTRLADDEHGRVMLDHLRASGVVLAEGSVVPGGRTSTSTAHLDEHHAASYEFEMDWDLPRQEVPTEALGVHVGSIGSALEPGRRAVLDLVRRAAEEGMFVSYDPNIRPSFFDDPAQAWRDVVELASYARLVKLSDEDLRWMRHGDDEAAACRELLAADSTELVVLTRGSEGAVAYGEGAELTVPAGSLTAGEVVDTVGAGDSFTAALLAMLCRWDVVTAGEGALEALGDSRVELLLRGAATAAAVTCSRRGADPPRTAELPASWPAG
jgi:fructokinase